MDGESGAGDGQGMPTDIRKLIFSEAELQAAVVDHCLRTHISLPEANIEGIDIANDPEAMVVLTFSGADPAHPTRVKLSRDHVAAALIRYCGQHRIPLPRRAEKVLQPEAGGLDLMSRLEWS